MLYPVTEENCVFYFETETGNKVSVEFTELTDAFEAVFPIYCVDIYNKVVSNSRANDLSGSATRDTIVSIIRHFFDKFDCALVAFIDTSTDHKGRARHRLFKSWFTTFASEDFIIEPREVFVSGSESYSLLIIRKSYGNTAMIIDEFDKFIRLANTPNGEGENLP